MYYQNNHYKNIILEFNRYTIKVSASEMATFFKGRDNNYNEIEFLLASLEVLNSKITQILSQLNVNRFILFLTMYILHLNWLKSYMYGTHSENL